MKVVSSGDAILVIFNMRDVAKMFGALAKGRLAGVKTNIKIAEREHLIAVVAGSEQQINEELKQFKERAALASMKKPDHVRLS